MNKISDTTAYRRAQRWAGLEEGPVLSDTERRDLESWVGDRLRSVDLSGLRTVAGQRLALCAEIAVSLRISRSAASVLCWASGLRNSPDLQGNWVT